METALQTFQNNYLIYDGNYATNDTVTVKIPGVNLKHIAINGKNSDSLTVNAKADTQSLLDENQLQEMANEEIKPDRTANTTRILQAIRLQALLNKFRLRNDTDYNYQFKKAKRTRSKRSTVLDVPIPVIQSFYAGMNS